MGSVDECTRQVKANYPLPTASSADSFVVKQLKAAVENVRVDFTTDTASTQAAFGDSYEPLGAKWAAARDLVKSHEDARGMQPRRKSSSGSVQGRRSSQSNKSAAGQHTGLRANDPWQQIINDRQRIQKLIQAVKDTYPMPTTSSTDGYVVKELAAAVNKISPELRKSNPHLWVSASELVEAHQDARRAMQNGPGEPRFEELQNPFDNPFADRQWP